MSKAVAILPSNQSRNVSPIIPAYNEGGGMHYLAPLVAERCRAKGLNAQWFNAKMDSLYERLDGKVAGAGERADRCREGHETAQALIERFLAAGVASGRRLLAGVTQGRRARIYQEPAKGASGYRMDSRGRLFDQYWAPVPLHTCPAGVWVRLLDLLPPSLDTALLGDAGRYFLERSEYEVATGQLTREPRGVQSPWEVVEVEEG